MKRRTFLQSSALLLSPSLVNRRTREPRTADEASLAEHVIADVRFADVQLTWPRFVGKNARRDIHGYGPKVTVAVLTTDQGAKGWGAAGRRTDETVAALKGKRLSEVLNPATGITNDRVRAFDVPLHDLAGVILGKPVYELLGMKTPLTTKCYSGMIYFDKLELRLHALAQADARSGKRDILASPHAFGEQFKSHYTAHLTGGLCNTVTIEGVPCTSDDVDFGEYRIVGGKLTPRRHRGSG